MDVFNLRDALVNDYASYIRSFIRIADDRISTKVEAEMESGLLWPICSFNSTRHNAATYVIDTFPIVRRQDKNVHCSYRTKNLILDVYDRM